MTSRPIGNMRGEASPEVGASAAQRAESLLVAVAVLQGVVLGAWLGLLPASALSAGGFPPAGSFFVRWAGVLHLVLSAGYALEWMRFRRTSLLVVAKAATAGFLALVWLSEGLPRLLVVAIGLEAALATAAALLHGPAERSRRAGARLRLVGSRPGGTRTANRS
jgi:hypothetical protein